MQKIEGKSASVSLANTDAQVDDELDDSLNSTIESINAPFSIAIQTLKLDNIEYRQNSLKVSVEDIDGQARLSQDNLVGGHLSIDEAIIDLPKASTEPKTTSTSALPEIVPIHFSTPLNCQVGRFYVAQLTIADASNEHVINNLAIAAEQARSKLEVQQLSANYNDISGQIPGGADFVDDTPVKLNVVISKTKQTLEADIKGNLNHLDVRAILSGDYDAKLVAALSPLKEKLPFEIQLSSPNLHVQQAGTSVYLEQTNINAKGDFAGYTYTLGSNLTLKDLPQLKIASAGSGDFSEIQIN